MKIFKKLKDKKYFLSMLKSLTPYEMIELTKALAEYMSEINSLSGMDKEALNKMLKDKERK